VKPVEKQIIVIGDRDFTNIFKIVGLKNIYVVEVDKDKSIVRGIVSKAISDESIGLIVLMEDLEEYVKDIVDRVKFKLKPLIVFLPGIKGSRIHDVSEYYTRIFKRTLGISVTLRGA